MTERATRYSRLVFTLPVQIAEAYGATLVELGAAAVEERAGSAEGTADVIVTLPDDESPEPWKELGRKLFEAFAEQLALGSDQFEVSAQTYENDYHAEWLERLTPQALTETLWFVPLPWSDKFDGRRRLLFKPEPCFGDGSHPTTRLASQATEAYCAAHPGCSVLDVGTGNGVLSLVAIVSGAASALGLDLDNGAVAAAEENARLNQLETRCRFSADDVANLETEFDLVVANLEPRVQLELIVPVARRLRPGGTLLLTGFLSEQAEWIRKAAQSVGLRELEPLRSSVRPHPDVNADMARLARQLDPPPVGTALNDATLDALDEASLDEPDTGDSEHNSDESRYVLLAWTRPVPSLARGRS